MIKLDADIEWLNRSKSFRTNMLRGVCFSTMLAGLVYGFLNLFIFEQKWLGVFELVFAIYSTYLFCNSNSLKSSEIHSKIYVLFLFLIVFVGIYLTKIQNYSFVWLFFCAIVGYLIFGKSVAIKINVVCLPIGGVLYTWKLTNSGTGLEIFPIINVVFCLSAIWAVAHVYEYNREKTEKKLTSLALLDPLTKIDNRLSLALSFEKMVATHGRQTDPFSLLLVDLDFFKAINDQYGHDVGDEVIMKVAKRVKNSVRRSDTVYRVGGEEFCVLLPYTGRKMACAVAEHIRKVLCREDFCVGDHQVKISASIGVSVYCEDGAQLDAMFKVADDYLYRAKGAGRNKVVYNV